MIKFDLTNKYKPHTCQLPFHQDATKVRYRAVFGGTGSGKTLAGTVEDVYWALRYPGITGYIFEPTIPMVRRILLPTLQKILGPLTKCPIIKTFNKSNLHLIFKNSSHIWLGSLEKSERVEGINIDFAHIDEARLVNNLDLAWKVITRRLRGSKSNLPKGAWITTTPDYHGSTLHSLFENPKTKIGNSKIYRFPLISNRKNLPSGYIEEMKKIHTGSLYKRFIDGLFAPNEGVTFYFDYSVHVQNYKEPLLGDCTVSFGVDFGWTNPTAILVVLFDKDGRAYVAEEIYQRRLSNQDLIKICLDYQKVWGDGTFWCDRSSPKAIEILCNNSIDAKPSKHKREDGIRELGGRLQNAGDGKCRLYISPTCVNLIDEIQHYNEQRNGSDHTIDALRYCLIEESKPKVEHAFIFGY